MAAVMWRALCLCVLGCAMLPVRAAPPEAVNWLQRMGQASRTLSFVGVYTYEGGGRSERARITHVVDGAGQHERLESLDGMSREVVRTNDEVQTFFPRERLVVIDRAGSGNFPGRTVSVVSGLGDFYVLRMGDASGKVAGRDAQMIRLEPRDDMRYGHELWADVATGLLLKARMLKGTGEVVEQFAFNEISLGLPLDRERTKPRFSRGPDWKVVNARGNDVRIDEAGWIFRGLPPGFRQVSMARRQVRREGPEALHAVFSDGLASVSVFIEPAGGRNMSVAPSLRHAGSVSMYHSSRADHLVTAVGEVPPAALKRIAEGVEQAAPPARP